MQFAGVLPEDAPDPRVEYAEMLTAMPIPVIEFAAQRSLEITDIGVNYGTDRGGFSVPAIAKRVGSKPRDVKHVDVDHQSRDKFISGTSSSPTKLKSSMTQSGQFA